MIFYIVCPNDRRFAGAHDAEDDAYQEEARGPQDRKRHPECACGRNHHCSGMVALPGPIGQRDRPLVFPIFYRRFWAHPAGPRSPGEAAVRPRCRRPPAVSRTPKAPRVGPFRAIGTRPADGARTRRRVLSACRPTALADAPPSPLRSAGRLSASVELCRSACVCPFPKPEYR